MCDETLYVVKCTLSPFEEYIFFFTREALLNRVLSAKAGPCIVPNELSIGQNSALNVHTQIRGGLYRFTLGKLMANLHQIQNVLRMLRIT